MTFSLLVYCVAALALVVLGVLFRTGRYPGITGDGGRAATAVSSWTFVAAGIAAAQAAAYLIQRGYPGEPDVYSVVRWAFCAALVGVGVRVVLLLR
ncbi:hypothetical protein AB0M36_14405 [Actinoplanes sp. NPDC051346]|uniref:hypothetical protein n=1 Tax=Actinoplanes sp. NPDC051346 TaxID=3155048 RepID=UPI00343BAAEC